MSLRQKQKSVDIRLSYCKNKKGVFWDTERECCTEIIFGVKSADNVYQMTIDNIRISDWSYPCRPNVTVKHFRACILAKVSQLRLLASRQVKATAAALVYGNGGTPRQTDRETS